MDSSLNRCIMHGWARMQVVDKVRVPRFNSDSNQSVHGLQERFNMGWLHELLGLKPDHVQGGPTRLAWRGLHSLAGEPAADTRRHDSVLEE